MKRMIALLLVFLFSIESFAAVVSDNDGAAFITKAEFDSLKNDFQAQIDTYNTSIDNKIDGAIAAYLAGITLNKAAEVSPLGTTFSVYPLVNIKSVSDLWEKVLKNVYVGFNFNLAWHSTDDTTNHGTSLAQYFSQSLPGSVCVPVVNTRNSNTDITIDTSVLPSIEIQLSIVNGQNAWTNLTRTGASSYYRSGWVAIGAIKLDNNISSTPYKLKYSTPSEASNNNQRKVNLYNLFSPAIYTWLTGKKDYNNKYMVDYSKYYIQQDSTQYKDENGNGYTARSLGTGYNYGASYTWSGWAATGKVTANRYAAWPRRYNSYGGVPGERTSNTGNLYLGYIRSHTEAWTLSGKNFWDVYRFSYPAISNNMNNYQLWCSPFGTPIPVLVTNQKIPMLLAAIDDFEKWPNYSSLTTALDQRVKFMSTNNNYGVGNISQMPIVPYHPWVQETGLGWCGDMFNRDLAVDSKFIKYKVKEAIDGSETIPAASGWPLYKAEKNAQVDFTVTWDDTLPKKYKAATNKTKNKIKLYVTTGKPDNKGKRSIVETCKIAGKPAPSQSFATDTTLKVSFKAEKGKTYYLFWESEDDYFGVNIKEVSTLKVVEED